MYTEIHAYYNPLPPPAPTQTPIDLDVHDIISFLLNMERTERCTPTVILSPRSAFCSDSVAYVSPIVLQALTNRRFPSSVVIATQSSVHAGVHEIGVTGDVAFQ